MKETFDWVLRAIESSTNGFHLDGCQILIDLFRKIYAAPDMRKQLQQALDDKVSILEVQHPQEEQD
jgi:hypothetical protein